MATISDISSCNTAINFIEQYSENTINQSSEETLRPQSVIPSLASKMDIHLKSDPNFIITPISKKDTSTHHPRKDWQEQLNRSHSNLQMMWDDSRYNSAKPGDILIVWHHESHVTFHFITHIFPPSTRLPSWSDNVGHSDRNVIYITPHFHNMTWSIWLSLDGPSRCMGTANLKKAKFNLLQYLNL